MAHTTGLPNGTANRHQLEFRLRLEYSYVVMLALPRNLDRTSDGSDNREIGLGPLDRVHIWRSHPQIWSKTMLSFPLFHLWPMVPASPRARTLSGVKSTTTYDCTYGAVLSA